MPKKVKKILIIANNGPEDPNRATVPFLTAKALADRGIDVSIWLYNNAIYLMKEGTAENVQAPGLPPLEDLLLYLTMSHPIPIYIGVSCAMGRGFCDERQQPTVKFSAGELSDPTKLAALIEEADTVIGF
jgi:sulfur relay (sulfurtransferase) complex TusBCD TusD component (DsrE family)